MATDHLYTVIKGATPMDLEKGVNDWITTNKDSVPSGSMVIEVVNGKTSYYQPMIHKKHK